MIDKQLLQRIRKCLALSRSSNEHEAVAALAKARQMMDDHGVSEDDLAMAEVEEATARASRTLRPPRWEAILCCSVRRAIGVQVMIDARGDRTYLGRGARPEVAAYAFAVLFRRLKAARADYIHSHLKRCKPARKRLRADVFCEAWAWAVYRTISALIPEPPEDDLVGQYLEKHYPGLVSVAARGASAKGQNTDKDYWRGLAAGGKVELNGAIQTSGAALSLT